MKARARFNTATLKRSRYFAVSAGHYGGSVRRFDLRWPEVHERDEVVFPPSTHRDLSLVS
jgi:hypothetical protein